jgi:hypothetical protein
MTIYGVITKGSDANKYSLGNDVHNKRWNTTNPSQFSAYLFLDNKEASQVVVRQIEMNPDNRGLMPKTLNIQEVSNWPVKTSLNHLYAQFWAGATFFNIFTNMFVWLYL